MSLRLLADHCVPTSVILALRNAGHEVIPLRDILPTDSPDPAVISKAAELDCVLLSLNGDFADVVAYPPGKFNGIITIQLRNHPEIIPELMAGLIRRLDAHGEMSDYKGKLLIVEAGRIRIRR